MCLRLQTIRGHSGRCASVSPVSQDIKAADRVCGVGEQLFSRQRCGSSGGSGLVGLWSGQAVLVHEQYEVFEVQKNNPQLEKE